MKQLQMVGLQLSKDIEFRARHDSYANVIIVSKAVFQLASSSSARIEAPPISTPSVLTKNMITNASFRTKKLECDIPRVETEEEAGNLNTDKMGIITEEGEVDVERINKLNLKESSDAPDGADKVKIAEKIKAKMDNVREKDVEMKTKQLSKVDKVELVKEKIVGLPSGWEVRDCKGGGKIFISSGGEKLNGISSALRFMVKHNLAEEEISQLREYSISLGWRPDPMLPPNWFVKRGSKTTSYLGPMGEFFRTKDKMMRYLNIDVEDQKDSKLEVEHKVENSPAKKVKKSAKKSSSESWSPSDGTIPEDWKFKKSEDGSNLYLLTPEGKVIPGREKSLPEIFKSVL